MGKFLKPKWFDKYTNIYRASGWRGLVKEGGIKLIVVFFLFYLIRDTILYVLPVVLAAQGFRACG